AKLERFERPDRLEVGVVRRWRAGDSEDTDAMHVAEAILGFFERGNRLELDLYAAAVDLEHQRLARAGADDLLHVWEALDRSPVDGENQVARLKSGRLRSTAGLDRVDAGRCARLAKNHEESGKNHDGEWEIGPRPRHHDRRPAGHRLMNKAVSALFIGHGGKRSRIRDTGRVLVTEEFHVAAEWNGGELPACAVTVVEAKK